MPSGFLDPYWSAVPLPLGTHDPSRLLLLWPVLERLWGKRLSLGKRNGIFVGSQGISARAPGFAPARGLPCSPEQELPVRDIGETAAAATRAGIAL